MSVRRVRQVREEEKVYPAPQVTPANRGKWDSQENQ
jgi:hypothetical protein